MARPVAASAPFLLLASALLARAAEPLSKAAAVAAEARLQQVKAFADDYVAWRHDNYQDTCTNRTRRFQQDCANVPDSACKNWVCSDPSHTTETDCTTNGFWWNEDGDAPDTDCCKDGEKRCEDCCEACLNQSSPEYQQYCVATAQGASVCGTEQGHCYTCVGLPGIDSEGWCESYSTCRGAEWVGGTWVGGTWVDGQSNCAAAGGTWVEGQWMENTSATIFDCEVGYCATCVGVSTEKSHEADCVSSGSCAGISNPPGDRTSCIDQGGTWTQGQWTTVSATDEQDCESRTHHKWVTPQRYEYGDTMMTNTLRRADCSTGPWHSEPEHVMTPDCVDGALFMQDAAAGKSMSQAAADNLTYYESQVGRVTIGNPYVVNHVNASDRARFTFTSRLCFGIISGANNQGQIELYGTNMTNVLVLDPTNYADADAITFFGGNVGIFGGTNAGEINAFSDGRIEVWGVENSGPINATTSQDIVLANVANKVGGVINAVNVSATLIDITNEGSVVVKDGEYKAYKIANTGSVVIEAGSLELELICPASCNGGTVTLKTGVTGRVTYEPGCRGTITNEGSGVEVAEVAGSSAHAAACAPTPAPTPAPPAPPGGAPAPAPAVVTGSIPLAVTDVQAFQSNANQVQAVKTAIAGFVGGGVTHQNVELIFPSRRLNAERNRRLADVTLGYAITLPPSVDANTAVSQLRNVTPEAATAAIDTELQSVGSSASALGLSVTGSMTSEVQLDSGMANSAPRMRADPWPVLMMCALIACCLPHSR